VWVKFDAQKNSSMKKFLTDPNFDALREAAKANENDMLLLVAGKQTTVWDVLSTLRLRLGKELNLIPENRCDFLWVTDFPLCEWDDESQRFFARHHPFTSPRLEDVDKLTI